MTIAAVWAQGRDRAIGRENTLPWHVPEDARRFRALTRGHRVIMGRRTWESLPDRFRPLPDRVNAVLTTDRTWSDAGALVCHDVDTALHIAPDDTAYVIGGAQVYAATLDRTDLLHVTEIDVAVEAADAWAPEIDPATWELVEDSGLLVSAQGPGYRFLDYRRR